MIEPWEEVQDPAGGDQDIFDTCARRDKRVYLFATGELEWIMKFQLRYW